MKNINITNIVDPTSLQPFTGNSLKFLQDAQSERASGIIKTIITQNKGSYSLTIPYVISGCVLSDANKDVTSGEIFYGGEFFQLVGLNGATNIAQFSIVKTQDITADPLIFSNNQSHNVHDIFKYVGTDTATPGTFASTDLVSVYGVGKISSQITHISFGTLSTSYVDVTGMTFTNTSGSNKTFLITAKLYMEMSSSDCNFSYLQLWDGTNQLDINVGGIINASVIPGGSPVDVNGYFPLTVSYVGLIANGTIIKLRVKNGYSLSVDYNAISMTVIEI